jgi:hypothetical protein
MFSSGAMAEIKATKKLTLQATSTTGKDKK